MNFDQSFFPVLYYAFEIWSDNARIVYRMKELWKMRNWLRNETRTSPVMQIITLNPLPLSTRVHFVFLSLTWNGFLVTRIECRVCLTDITQLFVNQSPRIKFHRDSEMYNCPSWRVNAYLLGLESKYVVSVQLTSSFDRIGCVIKGNDTLFHSLTLINMGSLGQRHILWYRNRL